MSSHLNELKKAKKNLTDEHSSLVFQEHLHKLESMDFFVISICTMLMLLPTIYIVALGDIKDIVISLVIFFMTPFIVRRGIDVTYGEKSFKRRKRIIYTKEEILKLNKEIQIETIKEQQKRKTVGVVPSMIKDLKTLKNTNINLGQEIKITISPTKKKIEPVRF